VTPLRARSAFEGELQKTLDSTAPALVY